jgi:hypothetical protein
VNEVFGILDHPGVSLATVVLWLCARDWFSAGNNVLNKEPHWTSGKCIKRLIYATIVDRVRTYLLNNLINNCGLGSDDVSTYRPPTGSFFY